MSEHKLTKVEKALILLAEHIELCPYNQYRVTRELLNALEIEFIVNESPKDKI